VLFSLTFWPKRSIYRIFNCLRPCRFRFIYRRSTTGRNITIHMKVISDISIYFISLKRQNW